MDQRGPQVVAEPGLEVVVPGEHAYAMLQQHSEGDKLAPPPQTPPKSRKRLWWVVGAIVLVAVIVGAVVGGVVGSRAASSSSSSSPSTSTSSGGGSGHHPSATTSSTASTTTSEPLKSIRPNSALAVTGHRGNGDFKVRLFYQGPDNMLRHSDFSSVTDKWTTSTALDDLAPMAKTPVAAGTWLGVSPPQINLYYVDDASVLRGQRFQEGITPATGSSGDINGYPMKIDRSSRLAGFHPFVVSQDSDGKMRWTHWHAPGTWDNRTFDDGNVVGSPGCGAVVTSAAVVYLNSGALLYRSRAGDMQGYVGSTNGTVDPEWAWADGGSPSERIPANTAIGAFVYKRSDDLVNTYAVYQDDDGVLQVIWQNDTSGWQGPQTYTALDGADKGTDIACVTQAVWDEKKVTISSATDMNRCYFQSGGRVKEVWFDGRKWKDLGYLPIS